MKFLNFVFVLLSLPIASCGLASVEPETKPISPDPIIVISQNSGGLANYTPERAHGLRAMFEMHCKAGNERYCVELAEMLRAGLGGEKQEARANLLIKNVCKNGYKPACAQMRK